ncbi:MAG TPA: hypothetical protein VK846_18160, partial [Candidatus Limnocylindria bacterium]|nr:hypothetical protein [Candidatus Limnocylindria bacterium]
ENGEPLPAGKKSDASVWFTWIAPANGIVTMSAAGSGFDTVLAAYRGNSVSNLAVIDASDDDAGYAAGRIQFNARANLPYRICVAGLGDETGDILLGWNLEVTQQLLPEIGEQPKDMTVGYGDTAQFSTIVTNGNFAYQWFRDGTPVPGADAATLTIPNVGDAHVGNYFVRVVNQNQNRFRDSVTVTLQIEVPELGFPLSGARATGKFFDIGIGEGGQIVVPLKGEVPPKLGGTVNHGYSGAIAVSSSSVGKDIGEPNHCGVTGGNSVWYVIQAETNGTMFVNTDGSSFNTVLAAYVGPGTSYATLTNVGCDNNSGLDDLDSRASFPATANTVYYIAVDGVGGASGLVKLSFRLVRPLSVTNVVYGTNGGARYTMKINGTPNLAAIVQGSTNFNSTNWTSLVTNAPASGTFHFTNTGIGPFTNRYYRALHNF